MVLERLPYSLTVCKVSHVRDINLEARYLWYAKLRMSHLVLPRGQTAGKPSMSVGLWISPWWVFSQILAESWHRKG